MGKVLTIILDYCDSCMYPSSSNVNRLDGWRKKRKDGVRHHCVVYVWTDIRSSPFVHVLAELIPRWTESTFPANGFPLPRGEVKLCLNKMLISRCYVSYLLSILASWRDDSFVDRACVLTKMGANATKGIWRSIGLLSNWEEEPFRTKMGAIWQVCDDLHSH